MRRADVSMLRVLAFIEASLDVYGRITTTIIIRAFGGSRQQASSYMKAYRQKKPEYMAYCRNRKYYYPTDKFQKFFLAKFNTSAKFYLSAIQTISMEPLFVRKFRKRPILKKELRRLRKSPPPRVMAPKYFFYNNELMTIYQIVKQSGVNRDFLYSALKTVKQGSDVTELVVEKEISK